MPGFPAPQDLRSLGPPWGTADAESQRTEFDSDKGSGDTVGNNWSMNFVKEEGRKEKLVRPVNQTSYCSIIADLTLPHLLPTGLGRFTSPGEKVVNRNPSSSLQEARHSCKLQSGSTSVPRVPGDHGVNWSPFPSGHPRAF